VIATLALERVAEPRHDRLPPVQIRCGVTYQWQPPGDHWRLMQSGKPVAEIIPDGRYPAMHQLKLPGEPISDMVQRPQILQIVARCLSPDLLDQLLMRDHEAEM
jgi:hypothetical protein